MEGAKKLAVDLAIWLLVGVAAWAITDVAREALGAPESWVWHARGFAGASISFYLWPGMLGLSRARNTP